MTDVDPKAVEIHMDLQVAALTGRVPVGKTEESIAANEALSASQNPDPPTEDDD